MAEFWQSDTWVDNHYRNRWEDIHGYDPLDPLDQETEDDIPDFEEEEE